MYFGKIPHILGPKNFHSSKLFESQSSWYVKRSGREIFGFKSQN